MAMKQQTSFTEGGYNDGPILNRLWTKVRELWDAIGNPCGFLFSSPIVYIVILSEILAFNLPLSCEVVENVKKFVLAPRF